MYLANDLPLTAFRRARAAWLFAGPDVVMAGLSAAAIHGTKWLDGTAPAEIIRANRHRSPGLLAHSYAVADDDVCIRRGMQVTTAARSAVDIGRRLAAHDAVPLLDALMNASRLKPADVLAVADANPGVRGYPSACETLTLVDAGLPTPETQIAFFDDYGDVVIRIDMGWRKWKVAVEYDGVPHWADARQRSWDIDRIAMLDSMGGR